MKYIVVGDLHIGLKKSSKKYHDVVIDLIRRICDYASHHDIPYLIQVGDLFDNRKALTHSSIECALKVGDMVSATFEESYFIVGNHDTSNKDTMFPHSLIIFNKHDNIEVIDKPFVTDDRVVMLPWLFDPDDMPDGYFCIGHFDINGAMMNTSGTVSANHRLNFSHFKDYTMTLSGHYHTPGVYPHNVRYIGSPYQMTFNDMDSQRGFVVINTDIPERQPQFIPFENYPKHIQITEHTENMGNIKGNIVRMVFTNDYGIDENKRLIERVKECDPYSLTIKYSRLDEGMTEEVVSEEVVVQSKIDILKEFHNKSDLPEGINGVLLDRLSDTIYKEMKDNE